MNIEQRKLLLVGFLEHYKKEILEINSNIGLDLTMDNLEKEIIQTRKDFQDINC